MGLRQILLRVMLWSLGLSAIAGVCAILFAAHDVIWRVAGTGAAAAIASGLLLAVSGLIDRQKTWAAGVLGTAAVIAEFVLALAMIWQLPPWVSSFASLERFALTSAAVVLAAPAGMFFLAFATRPGAIAARVGAILSAACFLMMLAGSWMPDGAWSIQEKFWKTAGVLAAYGLFATASLAGGNLSRRFWRWVGVAAAGIGGGMALVGLWTDIQGGGKSLACVTSVAAVIGYLNLSLLVPLSEGQRWVRWASVAAALVAAALVDALVITEQRVADELLGRLAGAAGVVAACGGLALLILGRLNRRLPAAEPAQLTELILLCPRCRRRQIIQTGGAACSGCGLRIHVHLEEPRCGRCGYLLYGLHSELCPECGTPVMRLQTAP